MTVADMISKLLRRLEHDGVIPAETGLDSINESVKYLALRLADRCSDLAIGSFESTFTEQTTSLPSDFNGLSGLPAVDGIPLDPLSPGVVLADTATVPTHFEVVNDLLYVYPTPSAEITVSGKYWIAPDELAIYDDIPYEGKFDGLVLSMASLFSVAGYTIFAQPAFLAQVEGSLDSVLFPRKPALPRNRPFNSF
jgi:hypothetical protein